MMPSNRNWNALTDLVDFAFEPIVNVHTGAAFGYECLLRGTAAAGFASVHNFFDAAYNDRTLYSVDMRLRQKAIRRFVESGQHLYTQLFYNIDNRILGMPDYVQGNTARLLSEYNLPKSALCFEVSERHTFYETAEAMEILNRSKESGYKIALDDFGVGLSGFQLLYQTSADFIKIDRYFIDNIDKDRRKKLMVSSMVTVAHQLGITVIAEGVETFKEFYLCRDLGCDLVQGFLVQPPMPPGSPLLAKYDDIEALVMHDRRKVAPDQELILSQVEFVPPISVGAEVEDAFEKFREIATCTFLPALDHLNKPIGIVHERDLKEFAYSRYGRALLQNKGAKKSLADFVVRCPAVDINMRIEHVLEAFTSEETTECILVTDDSNYIGFLSARSLIRIINEKSLARASDQNPLTKLPGNTLISEYTADALEQKETESFLVYLDLDNFKPFNDKYGFREGDRVILMFADLFKVAFGRGQCFVGHVGGDDFFVGFKGVGFDEAGRQMQAALDKFKHNVESLYNAEDRVRGYTVSKDREGNEKKFPLLTASAAFLVLPPERERRPMEDIGHILADMKKTAKGAHGQICSASLFAATPPASPALPHRNGEAISADLASHETA